MKNVAFLESHNCSREMLQFLAFLKKCLVRLRGTFDKQNIFHFIDRDRNLFELKFTGDKAKGELLNY